MDLDEWGRALCEPRVEDYFQGMIQTNRWDKTVKRLNHILSRLEVLATGSNGVRIKKRYQVCNAFELDLAKQKARRLGLAFRVTGTSLETEKVVTQVLPPGLAELVLSFAQLTRKKVVLEVTDDTRVGSFPIHQGSYRYHFWEDPKEQVPFIYLEVWRP